MSELQIKPTSRLASWDAHRLQMAAEAAEIALWSWNLDTDRIALDERASDMWGVPKDRSVTFEELSAHIHPLDFDKVRKDFAAARAVFGLYEVDFRVQVDNKVRWISARGRSDEVGVTGQVMFGIFLDMTQRREAEEAHELLAREMGHRVRNLLHVAANLTELAAYSAKTTDEMARDLTHRLTALGRAHELVRPTRGETHKVALLGNLLVVLLTPYDDKKDFSRRVRVSVPEVNVDEEAATRLALVVHELATNSLKYGALSVASGTLNVSCYSSADEAVIVWTEQGGPKVVTPTAPTGFGSTLVKRAMSRLGGSINIAWSREGVVVTLRMSKGRLVSAHE